MKFASRERFLEMYAGVLTAALAIIQCSEQEMEKRNGNSAV